MNIKPIQYILIAFSLLLFAFLVYTYNTDPQNTKLHIGITMAMVGLLVAAAMNPETFKHFKFTLKEILVDRDVPEPEEVNTILTINTDESNTTHNEIISSAVKRPDSKKSDVDYLAMATDTWKNKEYDLGINYAYLGLSIPATDMRVTGELNAYLGHIYRDLELKDLSRKYYIKARNYLEQSIKENPNDPIAHYQLGVVHDQLGNNNDALNYLLEATRQDPKYPQPYNSLGNTHRNLNNFEEAEAAYAQAIQLDPAYAKAHYNLGSLYLKQGKVDVAIKEFQNANELKHNNAKTHIKLGDCYQAKGLNEKAKDAYQEAIRLEEKNVEAHNKLALVSGTGK